MQTAIIAATSVIAVAVTVIIGKWKSHKRFGTCDNSSGNIDNNALSYTAYLCIVN